MRTNLFNQVTTAKSYPLRFSSENPTLPLVVLDCQGSPYPIDRNERVGATHEDMVNAHARFVYPEIEIHNYTAPNLGNGAMDIKSALKRLLVDIENGLKVGAINISASTDTSFDCLKTSLNLPDLTPYNVDEFKKDIRQRIGEIDLNHPDNAELKLLSNLLGEDVRTYLIEFLELLEQITARKIPVFVAGGNYGREFFNLLLLADGVTGVGAVTPNGTKARYDQYSGSADNSLITEWEIGETQFEPLVCDDGKIRGFNLFRAGETTEKHDQPDLPLDAVLYNEEEYPQGINDILNLVDEMIKDYSGENPFKEAINDLFESYPIPGTSASAPMAAARAVKEMNKAV